MGTSESRKTKEGRVGRTAVLNGKRLRRLIGDYRRKTEAEAVSKKTCGVKKIEERKENQDVAGIVKLKRSGICVNVC